MTTKLRAASFQDGAVTTAKIAADAITNAKIADGAVDSDAIGSSAIVANKLGIGQIGGRRNIIINGAMKVSQRATSATGVGSGFAYPTLDRFKIVPSTSGRATMSQSTDAPDGFANSLKLECTTADTSIAAGEYFNIRQSLEGQDVQQLKKGTSSAEKVTVSFYVKGNASATYLLELSDQDNTRYNGQTFAVTTSWNRVVLTYNGDASGVLNDDNARSLDLNFWLHGGSTYTGGTFTSNTWHGTDNQRLASITSFFDSTDRTLFITGLQMEIGEQATPFEHRSFGEELALCQRYYYRHAAAKHIGNGGYQTSGQVDVIVDYPVTMRTGPSLDHPTGTNYYRAMRRDAYDDFDSFAIYLASPQNALLYQTSGVSGTVGDYARMYCNANGIISFDAEL